MAHAIACTCGACRSWEILAPEPSWAEKHLPGFLGTAWAHPKAVLKCVTCGAEYPVTIAVDPHAQLTEVEV